MNDFFIIAVTTSLGLIFYELHRINNTLGKVDKHLYFISQSLNSLNKNLENLPKNIKSSMLKDTIDSKNVWIIED